MSDDFGMIEAVLLRVPDGHGVRGCGQVVGLGFLVCHRHDQAWSFGKTCCESEVGEYRRNGMPCSPAIARPGVCQLLMVEFWASNPHRSNRTERDYNRTIVISAAWVEIVLCTFFCMACRLGGLCWSCIREIWAVNILTHFKSPEHRLWACCGFQSAFQIKMDKDG